MFPEGTRRKKGLRKTRLAWVGLRVEAEAAEQVRALGGTFDRAPTEQLARDLEAAQRKLAARRSEIEADIDRAEKKLANPGFVTKAKPAIVQAEREKLGRLREELAAL